MTRFAEVGRDVLRVLLSSGLVLVGVGGGEVRSIPDDKDSVYRARGLKSVPNLVELPVCMSHIPSAPSAVWKPSA